MNQPNGPRPQSLSAGVPLLLLPVNMETRFMDIGDGGAELWVRIYPDQIAIDTHEPELTAQEIADGKSYWDAIWRAGKPPGSIESAKAPWRGLAGRYGDPRAAWIALQMTPTNIAQQPLAPTPAGAVPVPLPTYPAPPTRSSPWEKPATTALLPDAWTVVLTSGQQSTAVQGARLAVDLAVGFTPGAGVFAPGSPVDPGMRWLVDFDAALNAGMALKIPLTPLQRQAGFDRIFVYGLRTVDPDGSASFGALLDAHHYTDGFAFVPQGAPTNNTTDASSAYARRDPNHDASFAIERGDPLTARPAADANAFARLVGVDAAHLAHVGAASATGVRNGTDMLTGLWASTLGYFLSQMMADVFTSDQIDIGRQYALAYAVPRGPLPAFRVGNTPYGVLPVTSLRRYALNQESAGGSVEPALVTFIQQLWPDWLASTDHAPHMERTGDPDAELVGLLGMDASSMTFRGRQVLGDDFLWNFLLWLRFPQAFSDQWWSDHLARGRALLDRYQLTTWDPRVIHLGLAETSFPVPVPTVQDGALSETDPLTADATLAGGTKGNYIQWLRQASIDDVRAENYPGPKPTSLLYKLLRQSVLLDYVELASTAEIAAGRLMVSQIRESEIIGIQATQPQLQVSVSGWEVLARPSGPDPRRSWAEYLVNLDPPPQSPFARLADLRASMDRLASLPTAELDRLLTETLDACSHRLDVWATAVATALLQRTRDGKVTGVHLGAFGWLENVRPATPRPPVQGLDLERVQTLDRMRTQLLGTRANLPPPRQPLEDSGGFIYAPSIAQAAVAAVLRTGYMTHRGTAEEGLLSIDLSSERVARALLLLDGVRQGQSLNALLGYLFEAGLHDLQLDRYAQAFRDRFPIVANKLTPTNGATEAVAATNVVDGLALRSAWDGGKLPPGGTWGLGLPPPGADQDLVSGLLRRLDDDADALGDLSMSEAVFQILRGNFGRAGGLLDAVSRGARPPEPEVVNTPRGGLDLTHRVAVLFAGTPVVDPAWAAVTRRPRAAAEPWLDAWLSRLLPDPATVRCSVQFTDAVGHHSIMVRLADLDVGPLDCLAMADAAELPQRADLEERILHAANLAAGASVMGIDFEPVGTPPGSLRFPDVLFLARSLRNLVGGARALNPQDLTLPERNAADLGGGVDLVELRSRASSAVLRLQADVTALDTAAAGLPAAPGPVRAALLRCSFYGVAGAVPGSSNGPDLALGGQATTVSGHLHERLTAASAVPLATASLADVIGVFQIVFGSEFVVLPRFTPPDIVTLHAAFGESTALVASDPAAPSRWLLQLTQLHPSLERLDTALELAQLLKGAASSELDNLLLGQLPQTAGDRWLGLGIDPAHPPTKGRLALACVRQGAVLTNLTDYAGLLIDEWPERIASTQETAAVAFHYAEPKARAPQALLLAVCPDDRQTWDDDLVTAILQETLELAKIRTVDLDSVQQVGQILPALYVALNLQGATVSTNLATTRDLREFRRAP